MVLFMNGQSVAAVGIGEADKLVDDDEGELELDKGEVVEVPVLGGVLDRQTS